MRIVTVMMAAAVCFFSACTKNENENPARYAGRFQGNIDVSVNGKYTRTIATHTLTVHPATVGDFAISNNVIILSSGPIKNDQLQLERTRVASGSSLNVYEYGTGWFRGDTLQIEFHQDEEEPSSGTVKQATVYTGKLLRLQ